MTFWLTHGPHSPSGKTIFAFKHVLRIRKSLTLILIAYTQRIVLGPLVHLYFTSCWNQVLPGPQVLNQNYKHQHPWTWDRRQTWWTEDSPAPNHPKISPTIRSPWVEAWKHSKERLSGGFVQPYILTLRWKDVKPQKRTVIRHMGESVQVVWGLYMYKSQDVLI